MTDTNMTRKDNNHGMPTHYGYRNKDFNDMVNSFFNNWLDFPYENTAMKAAEPKLEVSEDENEVKVAAELPGMSEKDVDLEISADGYLTISGEKKQERKEHGKGSYFSEFSYGSFKRTVALPLASLTTSTANLQTTLRKYVTQSNRRSNMEFYSAFNPPKSEPTCAGEKTRKKRSEKYIKKQRQNVWRNGAENRRKKTFFHTACRKCILKHNHIDFKRKIPTEKVKKE